MTHEELTNIRQRLHERTKNVGCYATETSCKGKSFPWGWVIIIGGIVASIITLRGI